MSEAYMDVISIRKIEGAGNLKAFIDIRINGFIVIRGCSVVSGKNGLFAMLPRQAGRDGAWRDIVIIADDDVKKEWLSQILKAYEQEETPE